MSVSTTTPQIEKLFLHWILKESQFFKIVEGNFFKNEEIKFIYNAIRNEWLLSEDKVVPGIKEIKTLIRTLDVQDSISNELMNAILKNDSSDFREEFVSKRFKAWILSNSTLIGLLDAIDKIKNVDRINYDDVLDKVEKIKTVMHNSTNINLGDTHLGLDFDDPDAHSQDEHINRLATGYNALDTMLGGGFDRKTLSVLLGSPGAGKCSFRTTLITIKNKKTGEIENITMENFFKLTKSS